MAMGGSNGSATADRDGGRKERGTVLVTGGSGFVGAHCVKALVDAGHDVRVLARTPDKAMRALAPLGVASSANVTIVRGDVTERESVERAVDGCAGVLHAANVFAFDPRQRELMHATNTEGTEIVLSAARAARCETIVHVSSVVSLMPRRGPTLDPHGPVGTPTGAYSSSKAKAEVIARRHQEEDAAIIITYPGAVFGPFDPGPGEMVHLLRAFLGNEFPFRFSGAAFLHVDVEWLARAHAAIFASKPRRTSARRLTMGGTFIDWNDFFALLRRLTGRALPAPLYTPKPFALLTGLMADAAQRIVSARLPVSYEQTWFTFNVAPTDDGEAIALAGPQRPHEETIARAIRWCVEAGHLPEEQAGKLVAQKSTSKTAPIAKLMMPSK
jgi:dihydroflavonol-4-reductase